MVGCGDAEGDNRVVIVDPKVRLPCKAGEVGEIWVAGESVAKGYWNRLEETEATFGAYLANSGEGPFLRTGDLGCVVNSEVFIIGRLKDVVIIRGVNYSPYAIEQTIERSHPSLRPSGGAVFSVQGEGTEHLVVLHELERNALRTVAPQEVFDAIRQTVAEEHSLEVHSIALLRTASIPKTLTGKTKRQTCRDDYLNGALEIVAQWSMHAPSRVQVENDPIDSLSSVRPGRERALRKWLVQNLSQRLNMPAMDIDTRRPFAEYGLDSAAVMELAGELQDYLGHELSPIVVYDYPNIDALCIYLAEGQHCMETGGLGTR